MSTGIGLEKAKVHPLIILERPVVGMTSPEFQEYAREVIQAIARMTKRSAKSLGAAIVRGFRYVDRKWTEAGDMHNRAQANIDERYARNFYHLRAYL